MKTFLIILLFTPFLATSQSIVLSPYAQQTIMGLQKGIELNAQNKKGFGLGVFYQSTEKISFQENIANYPFTGLHLLFPIYGDCEKISAQASLKTGLVNQRFFAITPELLTNIKVTRLLGITIGAGFRSGEASVSAKLSFHLQSLFTHD